MKKATTKKAVSLLLSLTMILSVLLTSVSTVDGAELFTVYFKPTENWLKDNARFAIYEFDNKGNYEWIDMTLFDKEENIYSADVVFSPDHKIIFCRMNPATTENNWNNRKHQTADINFFNTENCLFYPYDDNGKKWDMLTGYWAKYENADPTQPSSVPPTTFSYNNVLIGDTDMSGYINVSDVTYLQMHLANLINLDNWGMVVADSNNDLVIDISDVTTIQMYLAKLDIGDLKIGNYYNGGTHDGNLLRNGNFEYDSANSGVPSWWGSLSAKQANIVVSKGGLDNSNCLKIDNTYNGWTVGVFQTIKGLEPEQHYRVNAYIKTDDIQGGTYENGAHIAITDSYMIESKSNWIKGTNDWLEVIVYFTANNKGEATVNLKTDNYGIVYFDDIRVTKVNYPDESASKVALKGKYVDTYLGNGYIVPYTEEQIQTWIDYLDSAYVNYAELTGAKPFDGNRTIINCTYEPFCSQYGAYGGCNPIMFNNRFTYETVSRVMGQGIMDFGLFHEIGHNFDTMYPSWSFDGEITANYKMTYVLDQMSDKQVSIHGNIKASEFREYCKTLSDGSYRKIENRTGEYAGDGICYVMMRASDTVGWDTVKLAFRDYQKGMPSLRTAWGKFSYFMYLLQRNYNKLNPDATGTEVFDSFPEGELEYLKGIFISHYSGWGYIYAEDFFIEENYEYLNRQ